jgi:hypothetical protein
MEAELRPDFQGGMKAIHFISKIESKVSKRLA